MENFDVTNLSQDVLRSIEADSFWCMSKLLDGIQVGVMPGLPFPFIFQASVSPVTMENSNATILENDHPRQISLHG